MCRIKTFHDLLDYVEHQHDVIDYYADYYIFDDTVIGPRGVVVACNQTTFDRIATRYPDMIITSMSVDECIERTQNRRRYYD